MINLHENRATIMAHLLLMYWQAGFDSSEPSKKDVEDIVLVSDYVCQELMNYANNKHINGYTNKSQEVYNVIQGFKNHLETMMYQHTENKNKDVKY